MGVERVELEVFATNSTVAAPADALTASGELTAGLGSSLAGHLLDGCGRVAHALDGHAVAGPRPGATPMSVTSSRRGNPCEVVRPLLLDPRLAAAVASSGEFRRRPHRYLTFSPRGDAGDDRSLTWEVVIAPPGRRRTVPATLHLLASPSMVVSALELIPHRRFRWRRGRYLAVGIAAIDALARELESAPSP